MATWRCPHCATVQAESSRCFLCNRSATSCGTCARFVASFVGGLGYCGLDKQHQPLSGAEQRPCWTGSVAGEGEGLFASAGAGAEAGGAAGNAATVPLFHHEQGELTPAPLIEARSLSGADPFRGG